MSTFVINLAECMSLKVHRKLKGIAVAIEVQLLFCQLFGN